MFAPDPHVFLADWGEPAIFNGATITVIFDTPSQNVEHEQIASDSPQIEFVTSDMPTLSYASVITIRGTAYSVINVNKKDDGLMSVATLETR